MADLTQKASAEQSGPRGGTPTHGVRTQVDIFRILAYLIMTAGAFLFILPFLWMLSVSLMSLGEATGGQLVTSQALIEVFNYTDDELETPLSEVIPSFVKDTDAIGNAESELTAREYADQRDSYWIIGNTVLRGGLVNYITAWDSANFGRYFFNSVVMTALTVFGQTLFSIMAAYAFARMEFPGRDLLFSMFLATLFIPTTIILIPNYLTVVGLNNSFDAFYESLGIMEVARTLGLRWINGWFGLTVPFLASTFGIFLLRQFFRQIPGELFDAARIDGAGHLRFLFQVVVPISRASIVTIVLFTFLGTWNALDWPILVTQAAEWRPISYGLYTFQNENNVELNLMMAGAVITLVPVLIVYFFTQKQFTEGIATTGLKG
ncbi:MAG: carbohydrate ABC transporter permease [Anaerolineae bacterium]|nr:carbohydrate ABC transporter permease [Anaerolineae bacterium]